MVLHNASPPIHFSFNLPLDAATNVHYIAVWRHWAAKLKTKMNRWRCSAEKYSKHILYPLIRSFFLEVTVNTDEVFCLAFFFFKCKIDVDNDCSIIDNLQYLPISHSSHNNQAYLRIPQCDAVGWIVECLIIFCILCGVSWVERCLMIPHLSKDIRCHKRYLILNSHNL